MWSQQFLLFTTIRVDKLTEVHSETTWCNRLRGTCYGVGYVILITCC